MQTGIARAAFATAGYAVRAAMKVLDDPERNDLLDQARANALRLLIVALGDWNIDHAGADAFVPYSLSRTVRLPDRRSKNRRAQRRFSRTISS